MGNDTTANRSALLKAATMVRPAVATQGYIPALTHISLDGEWATAFNDRMAIAVRCDADIKRLVPGTLLVQGLASFGSREVLFHQDGDASFVMKAGRAKVKLPTLPLKDFPFDWPKRFGGYEIDISGDMVKAIKRCLLSVNKDATQPAQTGVTFDVDDGQAVFYSTDNGSVSRAKSTTDVSLPGDAPVIMPLEFCEQLIDLMEAFPKHCNVFMALGHGYLEAQFVEYDPEDERWKEDGLLVARLFTRIPVDLDPLDFPKIIKRHCGDLSTLSKRTTSVPDTFDAALGRALLVLGNETHKRVTVKVDDGVMHMHARSDFGDTDDSLQIDLSNIGPVPMEAFFVARGLKQTNRIGITDTVTILVGGDRGEFLHMVAHVREMK